ncbi:MAG TPA: hypothetical protein VE954_36745 [Oligoflexus sp.]|uniref:hypothetical protein n=1 Tax=Oligoflexus sp. TaxID=1971216 RepID=UPI002D583CFD|nr:hypothetical protein [Oligoflexus sp.]HYX38686.1 hypothetical protein [Oligoflexus sp.]
MLKILLTDIKNEKLKYSLYSVLMPILLVPLISSLHGASHKKAIILAPEGMTLIYFATLFSGLTLAFDGSDSGWRRRLKTIKCLPVSLKDITVFRYAPAIVPALLALPIFAAILSFSQTEGLGVLLHMAIIGSLAGLILLSIVHFLSNFISSESIVTLSVVFCAFVAFTFFAELSDIAFFLQAPVLVTMMVLAAVLIQCEMWFFLKKV